ncbi:MAG: hypothetical protein HZC54_12120 [Verrucomicrobia bacterium]|nr:hypothetical protein [Verrucomicrobiota bacterium]
MQEQPPIELNYAGEAAKEKDPSLDSRLLRVKLPQGYKAKSGTLRLDLGPGNTEGLPLRIRPGTEVYKEKEVDFRAELDIPVIEQQWGSVEAAALPKRHPVLITVETDPPPKRPKQLAKCKTVATINLNAIKWRWWPLQRDEKGGEIEGEPEENTPIRLEIDGSNRHGFRLEVWREKKEKKGYVRAESDFSHYLAPEEPRVSFKIVKPNPIPWEIKEGEDQRQIKTTWWAETLADDSFLKELPINTTIRVRAWPKDNIKKHRSGERPITEPREAPQLAMREIPLKLEAKKFKARVVTPDPQKPPVLMTDARPWEDCFDAEVQLFDDSSGTERYPDEEVHWKLLPDKHGDFCGSISCQGEKGKHEGKWKVGESGKVSFRFVPAKRNALFLTEKEKLQFYAEFEVRLKGPRPDVQGEKICSVEKPDDREAPTFVLDWAPKFDLGVLKLPFFIEPTETLELEKPDPDKAPPIKLVLSSEEETAYRNTFRNGGTIMLRPVVPWKPAEGEPVKVPLQRYQLVVGESSRKKESEKRQRWPVEHADAASDWPDTVEIPARSGKQGGGSVQLQPETRLHPELEKFLPRIAEEAGKIQAKTAASGAVKGGFFAGGDSNDFKKLGSDFGEMATRFFADAKEADLIAKGQAQMFTIMGMPMFIISTGETWDRLGEAVNLHRETYKRMEANIINFYYDFLCWGRLAEMVSKLFQMLRATGKFNFLPEKMPPVFQLNWLLRKGSDALHNGLIKSVLESHFLKPLSDFKKTLGDKLSSATSALRTAETECQEAIEAASAFKRQVGRAESQIDEIVDLSKQIERVLNKNGPELANLTKEEARELLRPLVHRRDVLRQELKGTADMLAADMRTGHSDLFARRLVRETRLAKAQAEELAYKGVASHVDEAEQNVQRLLQGENVDADEAARIVEAFQKGDVVRPSWAPTIQTQAEQAIARELESHTQDCQRLSNSLSKLRQTPGAVSPTGPGFFQPPPSEIEIPPMARNVDALERYLQPAADGARDFEKQAKELLTRRMEGAVRIIDAEKAIVNGVISRGTKKGQTIVKEKLDEMLDAPAPPAASPKGGDSGIVGGAIEGIKGAARWLVNTIVSFEVTMFKWIIWLIGWELRIAMFPLNLLILLHARLGAKICEVIIHFFHYLGGPEGAVKATVLSSSALAAGKGVISATGENPDQVFRYPYFREETVFERMRQAADHLVVSDAPLDHAVDEAIAEATKSGYDDYYPGELKRSRGVLYRMCALVLGKKMLESPPCEENPGSSSVLAESAGSYLDSSIKEYLESITRQSRESKTGFWSSLWSLKDDRSWNLEDFELFCDWVGWIMTWGCRVVALILAIAGLFTGGAGFVLSGGMLLGAQAASAVTAAVRAVITACGFYPTTAAYPRDALALQGVHYAMIFKPAAERYKANSTSEIIVGFPSAGGAANSGPTYAA